MKKLGGRGALITAILLGGLTSFLVWKYVDELQQTARPVETAAVLVAARPIPARSVLTQDMLQVQRIPVTARHASAVSTPDEAVGKVAKVALTPGEQVLTSKLYLQREESGLAFLIPADKRAVSVGFTEVIGSGGLIQPGDRVDVLAVFEVPVATPVPGGQPHIPAATNDRTHVANTVLQNIEVLAVAQRLEGEDTRNVAERAGQEAGLGGAKSASLVRAPTQPQPQAKTATLAVTPEDALRLVLAEEQGKIRLALRPANDATTRQLAEVPLSAIVKTSN